MALAKELLRISNNGGGKVDNSRFTLELLEALVKGGIDAQTIVIGREVKAVESSLSSPTIAAHDTEITSAENQSAELERIRQKLKETQRDLLDKSELLNVVISERDNRRRASSKEKGVTGDEPIRDILTALSTGDDEGDANEAEDANTSGHVEEELKDLQIKELSSEVERLRFSLDRITKDMDAKSDELEIALDDNKSLREMLRDTPDIDEETIHYIIKRIASFDDIRIEECDDEISIESGDSNDMENKVMNRGNEDISNFASAMFSTGKFLVDRELYNDSIVCFEIVLEIRRELYGWDDPLVGDALHMEGFVRTKSENSQTFTLIRRSDFFFPLTTALPIPHCN
jgi:hypothetical protein